MIPSTRKAAPAGSSAPTPEQNKFPQMFVYMRFRCVSSQTNFFQQQLHVVETHSVAGPSLFSYFFLAVLPNNLWIRCVLRKGAAPCLALLKSTLLNVRVLPPTLSSSVPAVIPFSSAPSEGTFNPLVGAEGIEQGWTRHQGFGFPSRGGRSPL